MLRNRTLVAATLALISFSPAAYAQQSVPIIGGGGPGGVLGGLFGGGSQTAQEKTQLLVHGEAVLAAKKRLEMLAGFDVNNSAAIYNAIANANALLGQIEGVIGYNPGTIESEIDAVWPTEHGGMTFEQSQELERDWRARELAAIKESEKIQSEVAVGMEPAARRDADTLDECIDAEGIRGSQQCTAMITAASAEEIRKVQLILMADARARDAQRAAEIAEKEKADALWCAWNNGNSVACK